MSDKSYLVAACRPWSRRVFDEQIRKLPGRWIFAAHPDELTPESVEREQPRYVFLPHWSWRVPSEIIDRFECVGFHMTDLPYGRGGSPLQNLIRRGHRTTRLTAYRMDHELDAGPVYVKRPLELHGTAEEIFVRCSRLAASMIAELVAREPQPTPQQGEPLVFRRRNPGESRIPALAGLEALYDFVRMLDAEGYPHAFLEHEGFRMELRRAALYDGELRADVRVTPMEQK